MWGTLLAFGVFVIARRFSFWPRCIPMVSKNETRQTGFHVDHIFVADCREP